MDFAAEDTDRKVEKRLARAREILSRHPELAFDDVWHSLICLEMTPLERLELALTRGRPWPVSR